MPEKTKDLELLSDSEISTRLLKTLTKMQRAFVGLALFAILATGGGFALNALDQKLAGGVFSVASALLVLACATYLRTLKDENDALISVSAKRHSKSSA